MKLKLSRFYLNTLLAGLVGLLTLVLILLYLIQTSDLLSLDRIRAESRADQINLEVVEAKRLIKNLQNTNEQQQLQYEAQKSTYLNESVALKKQVADLTQQLLAANQVKIEAEEALDSEQRQQEKLNLQLDELQTRLAEQQSVIDSSDDRMQALRDQLVEEKRFTAQVRTAHEKDKIRLLEASNELADKKRELVRNRRQLSKNQQVLNAKTRELTINIGQKSDQLRRNEELSQQLSLLNEEVKVLRERIRQQKIAATAGNQSNLN